MTLFTLGWVLLFLVALSLIVVSWHGTAIRRSLAAAENLTLRETDVTASVDVIIPVYNEADNIETCVSAALTSLNDLGGQVWVADDQSTDDTLAIAQRLANTDPRVQVVQVPARPADQAWFGKNWACHVVAQMSQADYLLFIDADVELGPDALRAALQEAQNSQSDLLTVFPSVICRIWAEWLVQPLMFGLIVGFCNFSQLNDRNCPETAFGSGPFMFFRRSAYETLGGHGAVAGDPVEDVALARKIKTSGMRLRVMLAGGLFKVRMYATFSALFEGWSKNFHLGFGRSILASSVVALLMVLAWSVPQLSLMGAIAFLADGWYEHSALILAQGAAMFALSLLLQALMFQTRARLSSVFLEPMKYGALSFIGGILVAAIAIASMVKTETGWGWTWRGRSLAGANADSP